MKTVAHDFNLILASINKLEINKFGGVGLYKTHYY